MPHPSHPLPAGGAIVSGRSSASTVGLSLSDWQTYAMDKAPGPGPEAPRELVPLTGEALRYIRDFGFPGKTIVRLDGRDDPFKDATLYAAGFVGAFSLGGFGGAAFGGIGAAGSAGASVGLGSQLGAAIAVGAVGFATAAEVAAQSPSFSSPYAEGAWVGTISQIAFSTVAWLKNQVPTSGWGIYDVIRDSNTIENAPGIWQRVQELFTIAPFF